MVMEYKSVLAFTSVIAARLYKPNEASTMECKVASAGAAAHGTVNPGMDAFEKKRASSTTETSTDVHDVRCFVVWNGGFCLGSREACHCSTLSEEPHPSSRPTMLVQY